MSGSELYEVHLYDVYMVVSGGEVVPRVRDALQEDDFAVVGSAALGADAGGRVLTARLDASGVHLRHFDRVSQAWDPGGERWEPGPGPAMALQVASVDALLGVVALHRRDPVYRGRARRMLAELEAALGWNRPDLPLTWTRLLEAVTAQRAQLLEGARVAQRTADSLRVSLQRLVRARSLADGVAHAVRGVAHLLPDGERDGLVAAADTMAKQLERITVTPDDVGDLMRSVRDELRGSKTVASTLDAAETAWAEAVGIVRTDETVQEYAMRVRAARVTDVDPTLLSGSELDAIGSKLRVWRRRGEPDDEYRGKLLTARRHAVKAPEFERLPPQPEPPDLQERLDRAYASGWRPSAQPTAIFFTAPRTAVPAREHAGDFTWESRLLELAREVSAAMRAMTEAASRQDQAAVLAAIAAYSRATNALSGHASDMPSAGAVAASVASSARGAWAEAVLTMEPGPALTRELRQVIVDALDAVEQTDDEARLAAALAAFDGWRAQ